MRAPSVSLECVRTKCQAFIYSCIHRTPRSSSSFTHGNAYLCSSCIRSSTPRLHATRRNPPSICNHKEATRLDFTCCLVHRWTRQVYFLGSNPSFVLCVRRLIVPIARCGTFPPFLFRQFHHIHPLIVCCIDNISLCTDDPYTFTVDIAHVHLVTVMLIYKCENRNNTLVINVVLDHHLLRFSVVK